MLDVRNSLTSKPLPADPVRTAYLNTTIHLLLIRKISFTLSRDGDSSNLCLQYAGCSDANGTLALK